MQLIYNNVDISKDVKVLSANIKDNSNGEADSISILLGDTEKLWRQWGPQKNDRLIIMSNGFSSGLMYLDEHRLLKGSYKIRGISVPITAKTIKSRVWENISFVNLANDLVSEIGLQVEFYNTKNFTYKRIEQSNKTNLEFLNERCILEGYNLKISNGKAVIYDVRTFESSISIMSLSPSSFVGDYDFKCISSGLYSSCEIKYLNNEDKFVDYKYTNEKTPIGPILKIDNIKALSLSEAERFSRNLLKYFNKDEYSGTFALKNNSDVAAGNKILINDIGSFSGYYFIENIYKDITKDITSFKARKIMPDY